MHTPIYQHRHHHVSLAQMHASKGRLCLRMKLRQESVAEFDKAVAVLDAQPDPSKEGPHEKKIRAFADKVRAQVNRSVSVQNFRHKKRQSEGKGDE